MAKVIHLSLESALVIAKRFHVLCEEIDSPQEELTLRQVIGELEYGIKEFGSYTWDSDREMYRLHV